MRRCKVHFIPSILADVPYREKTQSTAHLTQVWLEPNRRSAPRAAAEMFSIKEFVVPEAEVPSVCLDPDYLPINKSLEGHAKPDDIAPLASAHVRDRPIVFREER